MQNIWKLSLAALLLSTSPSLAQTDEQPAPAQDRPVEGLQLGEQVADDAAAAEDGPGSVYQKEISGDWEVRCVRVEEGELEPCNLYQLLKDGNGNNVAEITMFALPTGNDAAAGAQIITPLETLLTRQITLRVDNGPAKRYQFNFCTRIGCFSQVGFTEAEVQSFRRGNAATLTIVPVGAPADTTVDLTVSLTGFTAGFNMVKEAADAIAAAAQQE
ncbi:MAG: invasion associated locus B family protein [Pseudomonadota bacterium]